MEKYSACRLKRGLHVYYFLFLLFTESIVLNLVFHFDHTHAYKTSKWYSDVIRMSGILISLVSGDLTFVSGFREPPTSPVTMFHSHSQSRSNYKLSQRFTKVWTKLSDYS